MLAVDEICDASDVLEDTYGTIDDTIDDVELVEADVEVAISSCKWYCWTMSSAAAATAVLSASGPRRWCSS